MAFRSNFRDKQEWLKSTNGCIDLNTSSDSAAKAYDAALTQLCGWYEDKSMGGLDGTIRRMLENDNEFVLGRALELELTLMGGANSPRLGGFPVDHKLAEFHALVERRKATLSEQETLHAQVVRHWARNDLKQAARVLEQLVTLYPEDISAVKMAQDTYFYLGQGLAMRNSTASCLASLSRNQASAAKARNPLAGYVHGMFAFALEESNMFPQAEREALKALDLIPHDTWAIHSYAHCLEMQAKTAEGLHWMLDRQRDWSRCETLAGHQHWHTALFHINNQQFDEAVALLDEKILKKCHTDCTSLDMHDISSMLYRMDLVDLFSKTKLDTGDTNRAKARWREPHRMSLPYRRGHLLGFHDAHYMMCFLGHDDLGAARELIETVDEAPQLIEGQTVVKPLLEAMYQFKVGQHAKCVDLLEPIRFEIIKIGGSHAQRDVFEQLLLVAALRSHKQAHNKLAQRMLEERELLHGRRTTQTELLATAA